MDISSSDITFAICQTKTGGYGLLVHKSENASNSFSGIKTHDLCIVNPKEDFTWLSLDYFDVVIDFSTREQQYIGITSQVVTAPSLFGVSRPNGNKPNRMSGLSEEELINCCELAIGDPVIFSDIARNNLYDYLDNLISVDEDSSAARKFCAILTKALGGDYDSEGEVADDEIDSVFSESFDFSADDSE